MKEEDTTVGAYVMEMAKQNGVAVVTVKDGWVFMISQKTLQSLLESSKDQGYVLLQVKHSSVLAS